MQSYVLKTNIEYVWLLVRIYIIIKINLVYLFNFKTLNEEKNESVPHNIVCMYVFFTLILENKFKGKKLTNRDVWGVFIRYGIWQRSYYRISYVFHLNVFLYFFTKRFQVYRLIEIYHWLLNFNQSFFSMHWYIASKFLIDKNWPLSYAEERRNKYQTPDIYFSPNSCTYFSFYY